jgi:RecB family exonuclease
MMSLPPQFQFSQTNLQDYADCPRRFELRHIQRLHYPSIESEPQLEREAHAKRGDAFHRLLHQYFSGVSSDKISASATDPDLSRWWNHFLRAKLPFLPEKAHYPEITLSVPIEGVRLIAKYDLIAETKTGEFWVMDWKTQRKATPRDILQNRLQTVVYPYVLARGGTSLTDGEKIAPEKIHMGYWYAETGALEAFHYDSAQFAQAETTLTGMIADIKKRTHFELTSNTRQCGFCTYRSLCGRGEPAQALDDEDVVLDLDEQFDLDWETL